VAAASEPVREGVILYYPRSAFYTNTLAHMKKQIAGNPALDPKILTGLGPWMEQMPNGFVAHLRSLGFQYEFADDIDFTAEKLKNAKAVFLSRTLCLGEKQLALLKSFVEAGGVVIAECGVGRRDADGRLYARTPDDFKTIFGVERRESNPSPIIGSDGVAPLDAERISWVPSTLGAAYRKGRAFFLDFPVPSGVEGWALISQLVVDAGLRPRFHIPANYDRDQQTCSVFARRLGDVEYLFVTGDGKENDSRFAIELPGAFNVYEMVRGQSMGRLTKIDNRIAYGQARVYALLKETPVPLRAKLASSRLHRGEWLNLSLRSSGERIVGIEWAQTGKGVRPAVPRVVRISRGSGVLRMVVPLNCASGKATLVATDMATGSKVELGVTIVD
jgi:hypothetical protein